MGDSRYVVEPNVKEGKGGLRDLHTPTGSANTSTRCAMPGAGSGRPAYPGRIPRFRKKAENF